MSRKEIEENLEEEDDDNDDDLNSVRDLVLRAILKTNRMLIRQNNQIIDQLISEK